MPEPQRIFIVEDHPNLRKLLTVALEIKEGFEPCGTAGTAEDALRRIDDVNPKIILIDLSLPGMSGAELIAQLQEAAPALRCLVFSGHGEAGYVEQAFDAGACGYVMKGDFDELHTAIEQARRGERYVSPVLQGP